MDRPINRIKVMLAEKRKSNKWLSEALLEVDINELLRFDELEIPQNKD